MADLSRYIKNSQLGTFILDPSVFPYLDALANLEATFYVSSTLDKAIEIAGESRIDLARLEKLLQFWTGQKALDVDLTIQRYISMRRAKKIRIILPSDEMLDGMSRLRPMSDVANARNKIVNEMLVYSNANGVPILAKNMNTPRFVRQQISVQTIPKATLKQFVGFTQVKSNALAWISGNKPKQTFVKYILIIAEGAISYFGPDGMVNPIDVLVAIDP